MSENGRSLIHAIFEAQAARIPDRVAITFGDNQLTYGELNRRANMLAHHLRELGVASGTLVGICLERSVEMIIGLVGILKAGGAYVPLDPSYPAERLAFMLEDTGVPLLLTEQRLLPCLPRNQARAVYLDPGWGATHQGPTENPTPQGEAESLAYIIYTSGSEGKPKGVMVPHQAVVHLVIDTNYVDLGSDDVIAQISNCSFDAATFEIWGALLNGARLVGISKDELLSPKTFESRLREQKISTLLLTTALFNRMAREAPSVFKSVRTLLFGGEAVNPKWVREVLRAGPPERLLHVYGPTEATALASHHLVRALPETATNVPIGRAITGARLHVLDAEMKQVPPGAEGELYISGTGLAWGYHNRPELTAERFISNPFASNSIHPQARSERLYKTGDRVRCQPNGDIEFLGRVDQQVKLRGFRIEPGEIEAVLMAHPAVKEAVVIAREDIPDDKRLCAYLILKTSAPPGASSRDGLDWDRVPELRAYLQQKLPEYMVPSGYVLLHTLPLTSNGKLDKKALPPPDQARPSAESSPAAPRNPMEEQLAGIWAQALGLDQVGINEDFITLGGHSLAAAQIVSKVNTTLGTALPVRSLFEAPTIAELASSVESVRRDEATSALPRIQRVPRGQPLPASYTQQQIWIVNQLDSGLLVYNEPLSFELPGPVDADVLERSINELILRHEIWRTTFTVIDGRLMQLIHPSASIPLSQVDLRGLPPAERDAEAMRLAAADAWKPFELEKGPLLRALLLRLQDDHSRLSFTMHHITAERVSMYSVFLPELHTLYNAFLAGKPSPLPELPLQYADYAAWQRQWLQGEALAPQLDYWKRHLDNLPALELPITRQLPAVRSFRGARFPLRLSPPIASGLKALSQREGVTLFMTLVAALNTLFHRYSGQTDVVLGTVNAARNRTETEPLIGLFLNTLVLRTNLEGNPTFKELLERVRTVTLGAYANSEVPFEKVVEALRPTRTAGQNPLFQVALAFHPPAPPIESGWSVSEQEVDMGVAKFDLTLYLDEAADDVIGSFEYNTDLFDEASIRRLSEHFKLLLAGIIENPGLRLSELPLLTEAERRQLAQWNETRVDYPEDASLPSLFEAQVARTPDAAVLVAGETEFTYRQVNARANQLARWLREMGVGPESKVGVCMNRSPELLIALLGVLKAGGAYVPMEPAYPKARLALMLEDTRAAVLLTQKALLPLMPETAARVLPLEEHQPSIARQSEQNLEGGLHPATAAYVLYTSGSTGRPKGVVLEHRNAVALLSWAASFFSAEEISGVLFATSICFDLSVLELFLPLCHGGTSILAENVLALGELPARDRVTLVNTVPSAMAALLDTGMLPSSVRTVVLAGEPLHQSLTERLHGLGHVRRLSNMYGPTECTTYSTYATVRAGEVPTIGGPIANTRLYVLDNFLNQAPIGVPGELYIGGAGVARGYLGRPELTAERFLGGLIPGERLYKTGDRVRVRPDGELEFLGRIDQQVKVRGFRIELGELEAVLSQHPEVQEAAVLAVERGPGDMQLVAYVTPRPQQEQALLIDALKAHLGGLLPAHMIPSGFVFLEQLPKTSSGKLDRRALPTAEQPRAEERSTYVAPKEEWELRIAEIWKRVLNLKDVGVHDNFFDLGGNSLHLTIIKSALREVTGKPLTMLELMRLPTIHALARFLAEAPGSEAPSFARVQDRARKQKLEMERKKQLMQRRRGRNE